MAFKPGPSQHIVVGISIQSQTTLAASGLCYTHYCQYDTAFLLAPPVPGGRNATRQEGELKLLIKALFGLILLQIGHVTQMWSHVQKTTVIVERRSG